MDASIALIVAYFIVQIICALAPVVFAVVVVDTAVVYFLSSGDPDSSDWIWNRIRKRS
jgi:hypothetical protein